MRPGGIDVAWERRAGLRVVDHASQLREVAAPHRLARHGGDERQILLDPPALVVAEEEASGS